MAIEISDILQEWDKPKRKDFQNPLKPTPIKITFNRDKIELYNYGDKKEKIEQTIQKYTKAPVDFNWKD